MVMRLPRILIAAPASGGGKTTVATGLMAALRASGRTVAPFKVGPDYIDPGYHSMASGRPGRNLDSVMCGDELMAPLLAHGFVTPDPADIAVIEGVMGLFDGQLGTGRGSSAEIATTTRTPVVVVVDTAHASLTHAAVVAGLATFDPDVTVAGRFLTGWPHPVTVPKSLGAWPNWVSRCSVRSRVPSRSLCRRATSVWCQRGMGRLRDQGCRAGGLIAEYVDLDAVMDMAATAPDLDVEPWDPAAALESAGWQGHPFGESPLVGMFAGRAFTFRYPETTEMLIAAGFRVVDVDPLTDRRLPDGIQGLYLGGGFPQMHATDLETNSELGTTYGPTLRPGCRLSPSAPGCCICAVTLTGTRWLACYRWMRPWQSGSRWGTASLHVTPSVSLVTNFTAPRRLRWPTSTRRGTSRCPTAPTAPRGFGRSGGAGPAHDSGVLPAPALGRSAHPSSVVCQRGDEVPRGPR